MESDGNLFGTMSSQWSRYGFSPRSVGVRVRTLRGDAGLELDGLPAGDDGCVCVSAAVADPAGRICGSVLDVFGDFACSRRAAELRFKAITGHSVQEAINLACLEKVKDLLAREDVKIDSIAGRCGWKSAAQLRVFFRAVEGVSLHEW